MSEQGLGLEELLRVERHKECIIYVVRGRPGHNDRPALPSGHPASWGAITSGTVIDGAPYPFPVFAR